MNHENRESTIHHKKRKQNENEKNKKNRIKLHETEIQRSFLTAGYVTLRPCLAQAPISLC